MQFTHFIFAVVSNFRLQAHTLKILNMLVPARDSDNRIRTHYRKKRNYGDREPRYRLRNGLDKLHPGREYYSEIWVSQNYSPMDPETEIKQGTQNFAKAEMLIRKPVNEVFEAVINPEITTNFWFTKSSGRLDENNNVVWVWEMYNHSVPVFVKLIQPPGKIIIDWGNGGELTTVEWTFKIINDSQTFLSIIQSGFKGTGDKLISQVRDSTEGFTIVLAGMKAWLEYGIRLNLVADRFPR
jgi:uncharacterized protein YndB with AHSA1/START domain